MDDGTPTVPILPGFHPDPSVCRVGDDVYVVTSSFEYLPGLPVHRSTDLRTWTPVGHGIERPSQMARASTGGGIFAPTLRHHDGLFWIATTDVDRIEDGQLVIHAQDPAGPWSEPVFCAGTVGIDPDLAWDDDGRCLLSWARFGEPAGIWQAAVDLCTGELQEEPRHLWAGTGLAATEGPHLHRRGPWWYLLVAEGGTERGHLVQVARSSSPTGPFEPDPAGPLLTHRSTTHPVQNTGHADLLELADGTWVMTYLGVRPHGVTPGFHVNGRETFLTGVAWEDAWPRLRTLGLPAAAPVAAVDDDFSAPALHHRWISPGRWAATFARTSPEEGLALAATGRAMLGLRAKDASWDLEVELTQGEAALVVRLDDDHVLRVRASGDQVATELGLAGLRHEVARVDRPDGPLVLTVSARVDSASMISRSGPDRLVASVRPLDGPVLGLGEIDGRYLSTEVAGGFTGRVVGVEIDGGTATVRRVRYSPVGDPTAARP